MSAINTEKTVYSYTYDPSGERIASRSASTEDPLTYTENTIQINPMIDKDLLSGNENIYLSMNDTAIAHIARNNVQEPSSETLGYIHSDHLGGSSIITDTRGTIQVQRDYYPFGETRIDESLGTPNFNTKYQFTGQEKDEGTGLYYYHARYYHPEIGRFISVDPVSRSASEKSYFIEPQRWNQYAYVRNNPIGLIDPTGLLDVFVHGTQPFKFGGCEGECGGETFSNDYINQVQKDLGTTNTKPLIFEWSGLNSVSERASYANILQEKINTYYSDDLKKSEPLNIITFSHGGNLAIDTINLGLDKKVDNLFLFAVPSRDDYIIKRNVSNIYNVYDPNDSGQHFWPHIESGNENGNFTIFAGVGHDRLEPNIKNIKVNSPGLPHLVGAMKTMLPIYGFINGIVKHLNMHSLNVWDQTMRQINK